MFPIIRTITRRTVGALLAASLVLVPSLRADNTTPLPDIGGSADALITPAEEQRLGRAFMRSVRRSLPVMDDPLLTEYIESLGQRLLTNADRGGRQFHFFLIDESVVNAFAGPAGHIGVYSGLILATESESELAAVVAHEISHVTQNHLLRAYENASQMSGPMTALVIAAIILGGAVSSDLGMAAAAGAQAAAVQQQINFTRGNEQEADRVGIAVLAESGFDPHAMPAFFERLSKASRLYENNAPEFLRTHPVTSNRVADAMGRAGSYPYKQQPDDLDYDLLHASLRQRTFETSREAVDHFKTTLEQGRYRREAAQRYGYALSLLRDKQPAGALELARQLLKQDPTRTAYLLLEARALADQDKKAAAVEDLSVALDLFPGNYPLSHYYAELTLELGQPAKAARALDLALERRPEEPQLHQLRSQAASAAGDSAAAHLHMAEVHVLNGRLESAEQLLEVALRNEKFDYYDSEKLLAQLRQIKAELELEKEAEKNEN
jgi:predicted Zn-dependent protease